MSTAVPVSQRSSRTLDLPASAVVGKLVATITASGNARTTTIGEVASVRPQSGPASAKTSMIIVDFGTRCAFSALSVRDWRGLEYLDENDTFVELVAANQGDPAKRRFDEVVTRQLRIRFVDDGVLASDVATAGTVVVATPPSDLEIFVNATRAWAQPGRAELSRGKREFEGTADLTRAFQDEIDAGRSSLKVRLIARTPATLNLALDGDYVRSHQVRFAAGRAHKVTTTAEGDVIVDAALPENAAGQAITAVHATLAAQTGPERVAPPTRPPLSAYAVLVVDPDRAAAILLPDSATASLALFSGVRIPVRAGAEGAELRGVLRGDVRGAPGAPLPRGQLGPATLEPGTEPRPEDPPWVNLLAPKPLKLPPGPIWVDVVATRGSVQWPLPSGTIPAERARIVRPTPGGRHRRLSAVDGVDTEAAAVRVVGVPPASAPVFPALLGIDGVDALDPTAGAHAEMVSTGAGAAAVSVRLDAANVTGAPARDDASMLRLRLTARTAGTYTLSDVSVQYGRTEIKP